MAATLTRMDRNKQKLSHRIECKTSERIYTLHFYFQKLIHQTLQRDINVKFLKQLKEHASQVIHVLLRMELQRASM